MHRNVQIQRAIDPLDHLRFVQSKSLGDAHRSLAITDTVENQRPCKADGIRVPDFDDIESP